MSRTSVSRSRAVSPVISAIIISAVVMAVGGSVWAFSQGAMTIIAEDYAEAVINTTDAICERFIIEQVIHDPEENILSIWVFNYGDVNIEVKITNPENENDWEKVVSGELKKIDIAYTISGTEIGINVKSRRDNDVYYRFVVPS